MSRGTGRNAPCHCGSGKKYKHCHLQIERLAAQAEREMSTPEFRESVAAKFRAMEAEEQRKHAQGYYLPHIESEFQGKRVRGVGSGIYIRPLEETFHEFLIYIVLWTLGERWFKEQRALPAEQRHFIMKCWDKYHAWKARTSSEAHRQGERWGGIPDGWTRSFFALGVDIYSLLHRGELPRGELPALLLRRLKHEDQYQGARYELTIAGMFVRLGCTVRFLDRATSDQQDQHCEFLAKHDATGVEIAVEAKSRHRPGVLGRRGQPASAAEIRGDVAPLIDRALGQCPPGKPFVIFIDANAPMDVLDGGTARPWVEDVENLLRGMDAGTPERPVAWNAIVVTNYSFHYATDREAEPGQYAAKAASRPRVPLPSPEFYEYLKRGLGNYGVIPDLP